MILTVIFFFVASVNKNRYGSGVFGAHDTFFLITDKHYAVHLHSFDSYNSLPTYQQYT